jgi:hypothetical protein
MNSARGLRYESGSELAHDLDRQAKLTLTEARARLAQRMHTLFSQEIASESSVVTEVRKLRPATLNEDTPPIHHELSARTAEPVARSPWLLPALALGGVAAIAGSIWLWRTPAMPRETPPAPLAPAVASNPPIESAGARTALSASAPEAATSAPSAGAAKSVAPAPSAPVVHSGNGNRREKTAEKREQPIVPATSTSAQSLPASGKPKSESSGVIRTNPFATGP